MGSLTPSCQSGRMEFAATRIRPSDRLEKSARLRALLAGRPAGTTLALTSPESLAWYLDGARVGVALNGAPVVAVTVSLREEVVYCLENEADRLLEEELPDGLDVVRVPWDAPLIPPDVAVLPEASVQDELRVARASLLPLELARYRALCEETAEILTDVLSGLTPETSERDAAARVAASVVTAGADPLVVLVAGAGRVRH